MPVARMRMRPWLEMQIDSNTIPGLAWLNKEERIFQIPWKHAARHGWNLETDASLFRNWAEHTGRFRPGKDSPDPKTWKANFRCAMNSLPDIEEVKDKSINRGSGAIRVYNILRHLDKPKQKEKYSKSSKDSKSKNRKKETKSKLRVEAIEPTKPADRSSFISPNDCAQQEMVIDSTNMDESSTTVDDDLSGWFFPSEIIATDEAQVASTSDVYPFQISPLPSPAAASAVENFLPDDMVEMANELLQGQEHSQWEHSNIEGKGYFSNIVGTMSQTTSECDLKSSEQATNSHLALQDGNWTDSTGEFELRLHTDVKPATDLVTWLDSGTWAGSLISCT
uniref:Interferon regulatory factor n=1 Tax=Callorhinchus milii TaxID=7868 RepID=A0A4W3HE76_CALMI|eukprot:gi/632966504/ref/XP_007899457.1/ PREDICTED: interferon regulatory factor 1 [Callorhinchus milii]